MSKVQSDLVYNTSEDSTEMAELSSEVGREPHSKRHRRQRVKERVLTINPVPYVMNSGETGPRDMDVCIILLCMYATKLMLISACMPHSEGHPIMLDIVTLLP